MRWRILLTTAVVHALIVVSPAEQQGNFPRKVTLLVDVMLPVPFAVSDDIQQPVSAGTEVSVKSVHGQQLKIAYGAGEGLVELATTDFASRPREVAPVEPQPPAPRFKPYDRPVAFERLTVEEHERQLKEYEQQRSERERREAETLAKGQQPQEQQQQDTEVAPKRQAEAPNPTQNAGNTPIWERSVYRCSKCYLESSSPVLGTCPTTPAKGTSLGLPHAWGRVFR
jgi:hypothetical protein